MHVKTKHLLFIAALAATTWLVTAMSNGVQAKYETDRYEYESLLSGDSLPVQAKVEHAQMQMEAIKIDFNFNPRIDFVEAKHEPSAEDLKKAHNEGMLDNLLATAFKYMGVRYRSGQAGPSGFDCSGFTSFVYRQHDIQLTHSSQAQYNEGQHIHDIAELKKGDLVFFGGSSQKVTHIGHVGIVTEVDPETRSFKFIHASTSSGIKVDSSKDPYYTRRYVGACRVIQ